MLEEKIFNVRVIETLCRTVPITATSKTEALEKIDELYKQDLVVLNEAVFICKEYLIEEDT